MENFYREEVARQKVNRKNLLRRMFFAALGRLGSFLLFSISVYYWITLGGIYSIAGSVLFLILFIYLVRLSANLNLQKKFTENLIKIYANELNMIEAKEGIFNNGAEYENLTPFSSDIDLFGSFSLFHLLNRTTSFHSKEFLARNLAFPLMDKNEIEQRQKAVAALSPQVVTCNEITATGMLNEEPATMKAFETWLSLPVKTVGNKFVLVILWLFPLASIASVLYYLSEGNYLFLLLAIVTGWIILSFYIKFINQQHGLLTYRLEGLKQYAGILKKFTAIDSKDSVVLQDLLKETALAEKAVKELSSLASMADQRNNLLVNLFLNSLLLYDLRMLHSLEKWKILHAEKFSRWQELICKIEYLISLAAYARNHPHYSFPVIQEGSLVLSAQELGHPMISENEMIKNDVEFSDERIWIVTGSNMAGKTTFLRTLGVNIILAQNGAPVCAAKMQLTPVHLLSSIRIQDSLHEQTSYFMAELKKLQLIIQELQSGKPALVMVDEILRGTNSDDKTHGSAQFIKKILNYNCLGLIATHDLALCKMEEEHPGEITNYCFESFINKDELIFDYKLRKGIATNKNASFLMEKMGVIN